MTTTAVTEMPTFQTARLVLRPFTLADAPAVFAVCNEPAVKSTTSSIPDPYLPGMAEEWIGKHPSRWESRMALSLAITLRSTDQYVGTIGIHFDSTHNKGEIGYLVAPAHWNHGYCSEAAAAVVRFGFDQMKLNRIEARHFLRNPASGRVMQKIGMQREGVQRQAIKKGDGYEDSVMWGILREDFAAAEATRG